MWAAGTAARFPGERLGREAPKGRAWGKPALEVPLLDLSGSGASLLVPSLTSLGQVSWLGSWPEHCSHCDSFLLFLPLFIHSPSHGPRAVHTDFSRDFEKMKSSYHVLSVASAPCFFFSKTYVIFWGSKGVGTFSSDNLVFADFPVLLLHPLSTVVSI